MAALSGTAPNPSDYEFQRIENLDTGWRVTSASWKRVEFFAENRCFE
jgi:hypothetical protein